MYFTREDERLWNTAIHVVRAYECERATRARFESEDPAAAMQLDFLEELASHGIEREHLPFDPTTVNLLLARGYLERIEDSLVKPTHKAYEAEFTDRSIPIIREVLAELPAPVMPALERLRDTAYQVPDLLLIDADVSPLVQESWLELRGPGYAVTLRGKRSLERAVAMHRSL